MRSLVPFVRLLPVALAFGAASFAGAQQWQTTVQPGGYKVARVAAAGIANGLALTCERGVAVLAINLSRPAPTNPVALTLDVDGARYPVTVVRNGATNVWVAAMRDPAAIDALISGSRVQVAARGQALGSIPMAGARAAIVGALASCHRPVPAMTAQAPARSAAVSATSRGVAEGIGCPPTGPVGGWGKANVEDYNDSDSIFCGDFTGDGAPDAFAVIRFALGANNFGQEAVLFQNTGGQLRFLRRVPEFYGQPDAAAFAPGRVTLDMTVMRPNDARCCPSGKERREVDTLTGRHRVSGAAASASPASAKVGGSRGPLSTLPIALGPYVAEGEQCCAPSLVTWFEPNGYWDIGTQERHFTNIARVSREGAEYVLDFPVEPGAVPDEMDVTGVMLRPTGPGRIVMTIQDFAPMKLCKREEIPARLRP